MNLIDNLIKMIVIAAVVKAMIFLPRIGTADVDRQQPNPVIQAQINTDNSLYLYAYYCTMNGVSYADAGDAVLVNREGNAQRACWQYEESREAFIIMYSDLEIFEYDQELFRVRD